MSKKISAILKTIIAAFLWLPCSFARAARRYASPAKAAATEQPSILVVACHWLGDTLWAAQAVPHLRQRWPDAHIAAITKSFAAPLWSGRLSVDEIINGDAIVSDRRRENVDWQAMKKLASQLAARRWDIVIDLTGNRYSAIFCHRLRARYTVGFDGGEFGRLYATCVTGAKQHGEHLSHQPFRVIKPLLGTFFDEDDEYADKNILPPEPQTDYRQACEILKMAADCPTAIIAPGAGWREKCWAAQNFADIANILLREKWQIVLAGSPQEYELSQKIQKLIYEQFKPSVHLIHEKSVGTILTILSGGAAFLGNDSGLGHIAAAMNLPVIVVFNGQTDPAACKPLGRLAKYVIAGTPDATPENIAQFFIHMRQERPC